MRFMVAWVLAAMHIGAASAEAPQGETIWIPMKQIVDGAERTVRLEGTLYRPNSSGKTALVLFTHGSSGGPIPSTYTERAKGLAEVLLPRGVALLALMRPGRGRSEGIDREQPSPCTTVAAEAGVGQALASLDAAIEYLGKQDWIDPARLVLAGHSRGGVIAPAYADAHPGTVAAVLNFSGGWKNDNCGPVDVNARLFARYGRAGGSPQSYLYAKGDGFYSDRAIESYAQEARSAGGNVDFKLYTLNGANGHLLFQRGAYLWSEDVLQFLIRQGVISP